MVAPGAHSIETGLVFVEFRGLGTGLDFGGFVHGEAFRIGGEDCRGQKQSEKNRYEFHRSDSSRMSSAFQSPDIPHSDNLNADPFRIFDMKPRIKVLFR